MISAGNGEKGEITLADGNYRDYSFVTKTFEKRLRAKFPQKLNISTQEYSISKQRWYRLPDDIWGGVDYIIDGTLERK